MFSHNFRWKKVFNTLQKSINQDGDRKYIEKMDSNGNLILSNDR